MTRDDVKFWGIFALLILLAAIAFMAIMYAAMQPGAGYWNVAALGFLGIPRPNPRAPADFNMQPEDPEPDPDVHERERAIDRLFELGEYTPNLERIREIALQIRKEDAELSAQAWADNLLASREDW